MIRRVTVRHFKRFREQVFDLDESMVLAGPNNAGKSTLLQAIATWKLGLDHWIAQRRGERKSKARERAGVAITRSDFTAVPLSHMNLLWADRRVSRGGETPGAPQLIEIVIEGTGDDGAWRCGLEFQYANPEMVYVRPMGAKDLDVDAIRQFPPAPATTLDIVHVPPLSGIERDEPRRERGLQDLLIGQGRPGEVLRNLLWEVAQRNQQDWRSLVGHIRELFGIELSEPVYTPTQPYILCEYREPGLTRSLDLSNVGSGTLQVLLLLAFLYARPASLILLDEPDAHQHILLQRQVYDLVSKVARERGAQVMIATHSEVVLNATEPSRVLGFFGATPRQLTTETERDQAREALKRVTTTDLLLAREVGGVLYVESQTDERILAEWAKILDHPARRFFERPYTHWLQGRNLREAKEHFFAMRAVSSDIRAMCLLDGDNLDQPDSEMTAAGLRVLRWRRYEIENYLLQPNAIMRFVDLPLMQKRIEDAFWSQVPRGTDLFGDHVALQRVKASTEFLIPCLRDAGLNTPKRDLYLLAAVMTEDEIHSEVHEKLDYIAELLGAP